MGLGIVVEYEGQHGQPVWKDPDPADWDYTQFGSTQKAKEPDERVTKQSASLYFTYIIVCK